MTQVPHTRALTRLHAADRPTHPSPHPRPIYMQRQRQACLLPPVLALLHLCTCHICMPSCTRPIYLSNRKPVHFTNDQPIRQVCIHCVLAPFRDRITLTNAHTYVRVYTHFLLPYAWRYLLQMMCFISEYVCYGITSHKNHGWH